MEEVRDDIREIKQSVKSIETEVIKLRIDSASNTKDLAHHIHRTNLNEARIEKLEYWLLGLLASSVIALVVKLFA